MYAMVDLSSITSLLALLTSNLGTHNTWPRDPWLGPPSVSGFPLGVSAAGNPAGRRSAMGMHQSW